MKNYRFTKQDEDLYSSLYVTSTVFDLADKNDLLKNFENFEEIRKMLERK